MFQRSRARTENDYYTGQNSGIYDEPRFLYANPANDLGFSSLDVAAFTKNSSVYKNQSPDARAELKRDVSLEPMSFMERGEEGGKPYRSYRSLSRRMRCLVALNAVLLVLTINCLVLTSFLYYKVLAMNEGERCKGCDSHSTVTGVPTVMPREEWTNLSKSVQSLKRNFSSLEEVTAAINREKKLLQESVKKISMNLTKLREEIERTQQELINNKQATAALNSTALKQDDFLNLWRTLNSTDTELRDVKEQVINMSKTAPPRGPPGYNGTQGPVGSPGRPGPRSSPGPGNNLTLCRYKKVQSLSAASDRYATATVTVTEQMGSRIIAVHCDTNDAKVTQLTGPTGLNPRQQYKCECKDTLNSGDGNMYCFIHYWECPVDT